MRGQTRAEPDRPAARDNGRLLAGNGLWGHRRLRHRLSRCPTRAFTLYAWAAQRNPTSSQVLAVLAQAAGALQATHEVSSMHRDVKGANMLVRPWDEVLFLTDFGSGHYAGAARLTPRMQQPSTPAYRSPELWRHDGPEAPLSPFSTLASPSDDVFALGVTAYRLVTDTYPPSTDPASEESRCWRPGGGGARPPRQMNPRMDAQLNALIARMLSPRSEERGAAGELSGAMRRGVSRGGPPAEARLFEWETRKSSEWTEAERAEAAQLGHRPRHRDRVRATEADRADATMRAEHARREAQVHVRREAQARQKPRGLLTLLTAVLALGLWPEQTGWMRTDTAPTQATERDTVALGDSARSPSPAPEKSIPKGVIAMEFPKKPRPGQRRPDANGRCPDKQVVINGGCWLKVHLTSEECTTLSGVVRQDGCYLPLYESSPGPTSAPKEK